MRKFAIYGKGGIGKSTTTANLSAALSMMGKKVVQVGCDPKADSTLNLLHGEPVMPVMDYYRKYTEGPTPGLGCAGRGIIATFDLMDEQEVFQKLQPDVVLYDVLGDVVCGGFSAPIRDGYADEIFIVTSGEKMALYAAANIIKAVENFKSRGYAQVKGIILNRRNVDDEYELVKAFADEHGLPIVADIPRSKDIQYYENKGMTVVEGNPDLAVSQIYQDLARKLLQA